MKSKKKLDKSLNLLIEISTYIENRDAYTIPERILLRKNFRYHL